MRTRRIISTILVVMNIIMATACGGTDANSGGSASPSAPSDSVGSSSPESSEPPPPPSVEPTSELTGTAAELLDAIHADLVARDIKMPPSGDSASEVREDTRENNIGLSDADFDKLAVSAAEYTAMIMTHAHQMLLIQAKDGKSAIEIKKLITGDDGYDPMKWICVFPKMVVVIESGDYVLLVAADEEICDAAVESFENAAGVYGEVVVMYEHTGEEVGGGGGLAIG